MNAPPFVPVDGRVTSLQTLNLPLTGGEVMEIVSPGNVQFGNNFQVTTAVLALFFSGFPYLSTTVITSGAVLGTPYIIKPTDTRILVDKTIASATYIQAPLAASMATQFPILIKDFAGNANNDNITITFTGGEECDGLTELQILNNYGWVVINPNPSGGGWYQSG